MDIQILQLIEGAKKAAGLTIIIDVFRAFSTACYLVNNGCEKIIPVGEINLAYQLKKRNPGYILMGEREERVPEGFDYGNSPTHVENIDFTGKTIIHTTSSGTQGIVNAKNASEIITGSFVNAGAIINYARKKQPETLSLVCMGYATLYPTDEDTMCAEYIKCKLENKDFDFEYAVEKLRNGAGQRLLDPKNQSFSPARDFDLCLSLNRFNFILQVQEADNQLIYLRKLDVPERELS